MLLLLEIATVQVIAQQIEDIVIMIIVLTILMEVIAHVIVTIANAAVTMEQMADMDAHSIVVRFQVTDKRYLC